MDWLFALLGFPIGIAATVCYDWAKVQIDNARHGRVNIKGTWAEYVPASGTRQFSVGTISFKFFRGQYVFDGTNYNNDGTPFCRWRTVASHIDREALEFHYTFVSKDVKTAQAMAYGYGVVNLVRDGKFLVPADGAYMYADTPSTAILCNHSMVSIDSQLVPATTSNASSRLQSIFPSEWSGRRALVP